MKKIYTKIKVLEKFLKTETLDKTALKSSLQDLEYDIIIGISKTGDGSSVNSQKEEALTVNSLGLQKTNVLVAEDNVMNQEIIAYILQSIGLSFHLVKTGIDVIEALKQKTYDLLLLDMRMPEMGGYEALTVLRSDPRWKKLPVIAVSAEVSEEDREKFTAAGCDESVAKPIDINELSDKIKKLLNSPAIRA